MTGPQVGALALLVGSLSLIAGFFLWLGLPAALITAGVLLLVLGVIEMTDTEQGGR